MTHAEKLKVLAEAMGKELAPFVLYNHCIWIRNGGEVYLAEQRPGYENTSGGHIEFNPEDNPGQLIEVLKWLKTLGEVAIYDDDDLFVVAISTSKYNGFGCREDSLEDAILQAAFKASGV